MKRKTFINIFVLSLLGLFSILAAAGTNNVALADEDPQSFVMYFPIIIQADSVDPANNQKTPQTPTDTSVPPTVANTPLPPTPTNTFTYTAVPPTPTPTNTSVPPTYTKTPAPPTPTRTYTNTAVPPTYTKTPTPTNTSVPPSPTSTNTAVPPTYTKTPTPTNTSVPPSPTNTSVPPSPTSTVPVVCNFTIGTSTTLVNGRSSPYNQIKAGDTVCIAAGTRGPLQFRNLKGTIDHPITFINYGGRVVINTSSGWYGLNFANVQHFRLTGTGSSDAYGFFIQKAWTFGIFISYKTEYFEIDHVEITELLGSNIAIHAKTDASCPVPNGQNDDDYDYNGDGKYDALDMVNRSNFTQHNFIFHDNYIHGFTRADNSISLDMAYYLGNSNYSDAVYTRNCKNPDGSVTSGVVVVNPIIEGVSIYNDKIDTLSDKALQVGSAVSGCDLHHISINKAAQTETSDTHGININPGSNCNIHSNIITNTKGNGITYQGDGGKIYNNIISNVGLAGSYWKDGIYIMLRPAGYHHGKNTYVLNNTIINPLGYGVTYGISEGTDNRIQNNIIVNPGSGYITYPGGTNFTIDHNYTTMNISVLKFTNPSAYDYTLLVGSPAIDAGVNLASLGVIDDYNGTSRPQGISQDIGGFEFK